MSISATPSKAAAMLAALLAAALFAIPAQAGDDAKDVARSIYRQVERACPADGDGVPYNLATIAQEHFSPDLHTRVAQAYADHRIDFDILIDAQDCAIGDIDVDADSHGDRDEVDDDDDDDRRRSHSGHSIARAEFTNFGETRTIELMLTRIGDTWKVADVRYRHRDWSLSRDLEYAGGK